MCGILGTTRSGSAGELRAAIDAIRHRGPDGTGLFECALVSLGHTRLTIIDPEGGRQPMQDAGGQITITFNGEIYNHQQLRAELTASGHVFTTRSDTEVLLHSYKQWGTGMLGRLRGMFAFAIADLQAKCLLLARDPLGIKPLVYSHAGGAFSFASEIQALLAFPWVRETVRPSPGAIVECLDFGYVAAPRSAFHGIHKLPPAHYLLIDLNDPGRATEPVRYWDFAFEPDDSLSDEDCAELVDQTLRESVRAHLVADVPFGAFLSGGLDSTLVVSYMAELLGTPVRSFSIGFDSAKFDETGYARVAASTLGTNHHEEILRVGAISLLPDLVRHYGEPFGDSSAIPTWHVSRLARTQVPMVLTGDGGDEWFAGYTSRYGEWMDSLNPSLHPASLRPAWKTRLRRLFSLCLPERFPPDPPLPPVASARLLADQSRYFKPQRMRRLLDPELLASFGEVPAGYESAFSPKGTASLSQAQGIDLRHYLPDDILTKVDIASMMHGLEARTPLVDIRVAEIAARLPWHRLFQRVPGTNTWRGKVPFRAILGRRFDDSFVNRKKMGFSIPQTEWLFGTPEARDAIGDRLLSKSSPLRGWVRLGETERIVKEQASHQVWHLLVLAEWLQQNQF